MFGAYKDSGEATSFVTLPEDHQMFVDTLVDQQTVMGVKTLLATPLNFPDVGRICITHHPENVRSDAIAVSSIEEGIEVAKERAKKAQQNKIFVIGGASIIQQCLAQNLLDEIKVTLTYQHYQEVPNPIYLDLNLDDWNIVEDSGILTSSSSKPEKMNYRYYRLIKK